tara:strand:+ start:4006 stop:5382 length:1377 start_codon:yes stop_codon:yes gene_type:complete
MEAVSFDNQRSVNLYPVLSEVGDSKSVAALRSTPGLLEEYSIGGGGIRGGIESAGRAFFVSGSDFYEVRADGTQTNYGTIGTSTGTVTLEENPTQIMIIDGVKGYIFNKTVNTFAEITDVDFPPSPSSLTYQDGYFIVTSGQFFAISDINNGLNWDITDRKTVESSPDELVGVKSDSSNLWLFGTKSTEVFQNTGNALFPFERIPGAIIETGCADPATIQEIDNALFWLGTDANGDAIIWKSSGYNAARVSTKAIERKIAESENFNESYAWVYHERGSAFYLLQVKGLNTTIVLDVAAGLYHERVYRNPMTGAEEQHRGRCHVFFNKKHLVGDRLNGKIYEMSLDYYDDDGHPMIKKRISPHYDEQKLLLSHNRFELDVEAGVGLQAGQGKDPTVMMRYSDDGGRTWSSELTRTLGSVGKYNTRVRWNKLGVSRDRVYQVSISDPVFVQINEAYLNGN